MKRTKTAPKTPAKKTAAKKTPAKKTAPKAPPRIAITRTGLVLPILDRLESVEHYEWVDGPVTGRRVLRVFCRDLFDFTPRVHALWASDGREYDLPSRVTAFSPEVESALPSEGGARPVNVFWPISNGRRTTTGATLCAWSPGLAWLQTRAWTPGEVERFAPPKPEGDAPASSPSEKRAADKRAAIARRNGKRSPGRPPSITPEQKAQARERVRTAMQNNPRLGFRTACERACDSLHLGIKPQALERHLKPRRRAGRK